MPLLAGWAVGTAFGWRLGMILPGIMGVLGAFVAYFMITDKPEDKGLAPVEEPAKTPRWDMLLR